MGFGSQNRGRKAVEIIEIEITDVDSSDIAGIILGLSKNQAFLNRTILALQMEQQDQEEELRQQLRESDPLVIEGKVDHARPQVPSAARSPRQQRNQPST